MDVSDAKRLKELEGENAKLKKLLAEAHLDMHAPEERFWGKALAPQVKREAIGQIIEPFDLSECRACRLVGLTRSSYRDPPVPDQQAVVLSAAIINIAQVRRRFGYRRIHDLLRPEFPNVNHKRVYRLYCAAKLAVRKRKKVKLPVSERVPLQLAQNVNEVWSMDFVSDSLASPWPVERAASSC